MSSSLNFLKYPAETQYDFGELLISTKLNNT